MKLIAIIIIISGVIMAESYTRMDAKIIAIDKDCKLRVEFINEIGIQTIYVNVMCLSENPGFYIVTSRDGEMGRHAKGNNTKMIYKVVE